MGSSLRTSRIRHAAVSALAALLLGGVTGCAPLSEVACDQAAVLCGNVDLDACDATLNLVAPRVRDELVACASQARSCADITSCFARYQLSLPFRVPVVFDVLAP